MCPCLLLHLSQPRNLAARTHFFGDERLGQGREKTLETLKTNDQIRTTIDAQTREQLIGTDVNEMYTAEAAPEVSADAEGVERITVD